LDSCARPASDLPPEGGEPTADESPRSPARPLPLRRSRARRCRE
jgi:hypothetical protein